MADHNFPLTADEDLDDLPRTLRRERAEREREARAADPVRHGPAPDLAPPTDGYTHPAPAGAYEDEAYPAEVRRLDVPFFHLMFFLVKAVLAGIPALILLGAIIYGVGELLQTYFPWLVKMKIVILFPEG